MLVSSPPGNLIGIIEQKIGLCGGTTRFKVKEPSGKIQYNIVGPPRKCGRCGSEVYFQALKKYNRYPKNKHKGFFTYRF